MTALLSHKAGLSPAFERFVCAFAAIIPAVVIAYSLIVDPLINLQPVAEAGSGGALDSEEKSTLLAQLLIPLLFVAMAFLATLHPPRRWQSVLPVLAPLMAFLGFAIISSAWSAMPMRSLMLAIYQSLLCALLFFSVCMSDNPKRIFRNIFWVFAVAMAVNLLFVILRPAGAIGHQGIYPYKNSLGAAAGCALILALAHIPGQRMFLRFCAFITLVVAVVVLVASESKTSIALALAAPAAAMLVLVLSRRLHAGAMTVLAGGLIAFLSSAVIAAQIWPFRPDDILVWAFGDPTFTGRTHIWSFIASHISEAPLTGHGYRGFWGVGELSPKLHSEIEFIRETGSSHNGFFDVTLDTGVIGLALLAVFVLSTLKASARAADESGTAFLFLSIAFFVIGRNMMESVILWSSFFDNLLFVLSGLSAAYLGAELRAARRSGVAQYMGAR
ncbi:O-antigen ligase family protein [Roseibium sp.]|uniref:O-antigen ligase family protein n=1 Tax=Roseibium sp. TaxID=1936156 RepID=UPI003B515EC6